MGMTEQQEKGVFSRLCRDVLKIMGIGPERPFTLEAAIIATQQLCFLNACRVVAVHLVRGAEARNPGNGHHRDRPQHHLGTYSLQSVRRSSQVMSMHLHSGTIACRVLKASSGFDECVRSVRRSLYHPFL